MTTAIIVQARIRSTRLPGKVRLPLAGRPVLDHVLRRCVRIGSADVVVCAIPDAQECEPLAEIARAAGAVVFKGSEQDVLRRYAGAAREVGADIVMRVTSDCPLIDPDLCDAVIRKLVSENGDYASNNDPPSWPHGLDCEVMTAAVLHLADESADDPFDREHVTPWIRRERNRRHLNVASPADRSALRWTLDVLEDYAFFQKVFDELGGEPSTAQVLRLLEARPDIAAVNAAFRRAPPPAASRN